MRRRPPEALRAPQTPTAQEGVERPGPPPAERPPPPAAAAAAATAVAAAQRAGRAPREETSAGFPKLQRHQRQRTLGARAVRPKHARARGGAWRRPQTGRASQTVHLMSGDCPAAEGSVHARRAPEGPRRSELPGGAQQAAPSKAPPQPGTTPYAGAPTAASLRRKAASSAKAVAERLPSSPLATAARHAKPLPHAGN